MVHLIEKKHHHPSQLCIHLRFLSVGKMKSVAGCIASHQLLDPDHQVMKENIEYFVNQEGSIKKEWIVPREEAVRYYQRYV